LERFKPLVTEDKPFSERTEDDRTSTWLIPALKCSIQYASLASSGVYREPVFQQLIEKENKSE